MRFSVIISIFCLCFLLYADSKKDETINQQLEAGLYVNALNSFSIDGITGDELYKKLKIANQLSEGEHLSRQELIDAMMISGYLEGVYASFQQGVYSEAYREEYNRTGKDTILKPIFCGRLYSIKELIDIVLTSVEKIPPDSRKIATGSYLVLSAFLGSNLYSQCK